MSQQPPDSGAPDSPADSPAEPPSHPTPPPAPPQSPYNPYAQPAGPDPIQPVWQGHQAPQQGAAGQAPNGRSGRTWLVVLVVILLLTVTGGAITAAVLIADDADSGIAVAEIETGDCLDGDELGEDDGRVETVDRVDCSGEHDAEVFATTTLGEDADAGADCVEELQDAGHTWSLLDAAGIEVRPLVAGDKVVCFIRHQDGEPLTGSEFE